MKKIVRAGGALLLSCLAVAAACVVFVEHSQPGLKTNSSYMAVASSYSAGISFGP